MAENSANVFSLQASISIDTTNFEKKITKIKESGLILQQTMEKGIKSVKALQQFMNSFDTTKFQKRVKGIGEGLDGIGKSSEEGKEKIEDIGDSSEDTAKKSKTTFSTLKESVKATFDEMGDHFKLTGDSLQKSVSQTAASFSAITSAVQNVIKAVEKVGEVAVKSFKVAVKAGEEFSKSIVNIVDKANDIENTISLAFGGAGAAIGTYAFTTGKDFESSMANVIAIMGKTKDSVTDNGTNIYDMLSNAAKEAGASTMFTATESADALGYLALAGYNAYQAVEALPNVLAIAKAGGMDLAYASDLVTDAMNAMEIAATDENLTHFGDVLAKTASSSNTSVAQLGEAMLVCAGQAKIANVDLEDTATMLGILADAGYKGSEGGTMLRNLLKNMYTPTAAASKAMERLNIDPFDKTTRSIKDVQTFLPEIIDSIKSLATEEEQVQAYADIFDTRVIAGANIVLEKCVDRYGELRGKIDECDGAMEQMGKTMSNTLVGDMQTMTSRFQGIGLAIYDYIAPYLRDTVQEASTYLSELKTTIDKYDGYGLSAGASTISDMVDEALEKNTPSIVQGIDKGRNIVQRFINGFADNIPNISENIGKIVQAYGEARDKIFDSIAFVFGKEENIASIVDIGENILDSMLTTADNVTKRLAENIPQFIEQIAESLSENKDKWTKSITAIIKNISDLVSKSAPALVEIGGTLLVSIVEGMATTTTEIAKILPNITETISNLFQNKEFSENLSTSSSQIIRSIGDVIVTSIKFIGDSNNIKAITDVLSKIFMEITAVIDEMIPELMPHIEKIQEKITYFVDTELIPFIVSIGTMVGFSFGQSVMSGFWNGLSEAHPILKSLGINNDEAGELWLPEEPVDVSVANLETPNLPIADIVNQIPLGENLSQDKRDSLFEQYKNENKKMFDFSNLSELPQNAETWGADMVHNFADGMNSNSGEAEKAAKNIADLVSAYIHHSTPEKGPLKDDDIWGEHFVQNFIGGITSQKSNLAKTVEDTAYILSDLYSMSDKNITASIDVITQDFKLPEIPKNVSIPFTTTGFEMPDTPKDINVPFVADFNKFHLPDISQNINDGIKENKISILDEIKSIMNSIKETFSKPISTTLDLNTQNFKLPDMPKSVDIPFTSNANQIFSGVSKVVDDAKSRFDSIALPQSLYKIGYIEKSDTPTAQTATSVTIQNINVNVEDAKISSDYDVRELGDQLSDELIEKITEKIKVLDIFDTRAKGAVVW